MYHPPGRLWAAPAQQSRKERAGEEEDAGRHSAQATCLGTKEAPEATDELSKEQGSIKAARIQEKGTDRKQKLRNT